MASDACMKGGAEHHVNDFLIVDTLPKTREMEFDRTGVSVVKTPHCEYTKGRQTNPVCSMNANTSGHALLMKATYERNHDKCHAHSKSEITMN